MAALVLVAALGWQAICLGLNSTEKAAVVLRQDEAARGIVSLGPTLPVSFLASRSLPNRHANTLDERWLHQTLQDIGARGPEANRFVFFAEAEEASALLLTLEGLSCAPAQRVAAHGGLALLFSFGLNHNKNNGPLIIYACSGSDLA